MASAFTVWLAGCSILPGAGLPEGETRTPQRQASLASKEPLDSASLKALADEARLARSRLKSGAQARHDADGAKLADRALPLKRERVGTEVRGGTDDGPDGEPVRPSAMKTPAQRQAAALALLKNAGARAGASSQDGTAPDDTRPRTYRLDGPGSGAQPPQAGGYQQVAAGQEPVASWPRQPSPQFVQPQQMQPASAFQPPDAAPRPANDPRALMEAVEKLRSKQMVQTVRMDTGRMDTGRTDTGRTDTGKSESTRQDLSGDSTGSIAAPDAGASSGLAFVQFAAGSVVPPASAQKTIATLLQPWLKTKGSKLVMAVGLGGEGEAYLRLLRANQRAQAMAELVPHGVETERRFDPALPNESVRLFVVKTER